MIEITLTSVIAVILGLLPGGPAEFLYSQTIGISRHESDTSRLLRMLGFSVVGLIAYAILARAFSWPTAKYIVPATFRSSFTAAQLPSLGLAYLGHMAASVLAGIAVGFLHEGLRAVVDRMYARDAWDHFINESVPRRWIIVRTQGDDAFAGIVENADVAVEPEYRDVILKEPAKHGDTGYRSMNYQYLFIPGYEIASIGVVHDHAQDDRVTEVGAVLFPRNEGEEDNAG